MRRLRGRNGRCRGPCPCPFFRWLWWVKGLIDLEVWIHFSVYVLAESVRDRTFVRDGVGDWEWL